MKKSLKRTFGMMLATVMAVSSLCCVTALAETPSFPGEITAQTATADTEVVLNSGESSQIITWPVARNYGYWKIQVDSTSSDYMTLRIHKDSPSGQIVFSDRVAPGQEIAFYSEESAPLAAGAYYLSVSTSGNAHLGGNLYYKFATTYNKLFTYAERNFPESEDYTDWFFKAGDIQQDKTTGVVTFRNVKGLLGEYEQADNNIYYIDEETAIYEHTFLNWEEFLSGEQPWITVFITNEDWERIREGKEYRIHIAALHDTSAGVQFFVQAEEKERNRRLSERGIMVGDPDGEFYPYRVLTRAEMAKIAVTMSAPAFRAGSAATVGGFADVSLEHWAHDYIAYAAQKGILQGYPDGSFRPEEKLTYAEAIKILVEMLGYGAVAQEQGGYPQGYLQTAEKLSLTKDLTVMADEAILRQEVAVLADRGLDTPLMKMLEDNTAVVCDGSSPDYPLETLNLLNFKELEDSFEQITEIPAATEYIGEDKNAVCSALNLKTEELKEEKASVGRFLLENQMAKSIRDKTGFSTYFLFGKVNEKPDCLYGVDYEYLGDQKDENNFALLQNLLKRLTEKYGEPSTYEGLKNRITKIESAEIIKNGKVGDDFREDWSFRDKKFNTLILSVECLEDVVKIRLRYQLLLMPGEK